MNTKLVQEACAMTLIGDSVLAAVDPKRHLGLWRRGPDPFVGLVDALIRRPKLTRALGVAGVVAGVWWASRQKPARASLPFWRCA